MKLKRMITIGVMGLGLAAPVAAEDFTGTLAKVAESGVITIGHRESSVPFAYLDENQKPIGYSIDLCMKIVDKVAETVGKDLEICAG